MKSIRRSDDDGGFEPLKKASGSFGPQCSISVRALHPRAVDHRWRGEKSQVLRNRL